MAVMVKYEIRKIMQKKILWVCIMVLAAACAYFYIDRVDPFGSKLSIVKPDGTVITGIEAVRYEKAVAIKYKGRLDTDKMIQIINEFSLDAESYDNVKKYGTGGNQNFTYKSIERLLLNEGGGTDYASILESAFPFRITIGYSKPWSNTIKAICTDMFFLGFVLIIAFSSVFADEYSSGMSELLLMSKLGRTRNGVVRSKIITAYVICLALWLMVIMLNILPTLLSAGIEGLGCSVQLADTYSFLSLKTELKLGALLACTCFIALCSMLLVTALALFMSAYSVNSFNALIKGTALYIFPAEFYYAFYEGSSNLFLFLFPVLQLDHSTVFNLGRFNMPGGSVSLVWGIVLADILFLRLSNEAVFKRFSRNSHC